MPRRLIAVAVALAAITLPAGAQRGGGHAVSAGRGGGASAHSSSPARSGFSGASRPNSTPASQFRGSQFSAGRFNSGQHFSASSPSNRRNDHDADGRFRNDRFRRPYNSVYSFGLPYGLGGLNTGYFSSPDYSFYDSPAPAPDPGPSDYTQSDYGPPPPEQADATPYPSYRPAYQRPQAEAPLPPEDAVTLVFKDGRPTEQIHNYLLSRTTLYIQDQHPREIPIDQLDLTATTKANADAGIDFKLPTRVH